MTARFCANCGAEVSKDFSFCPNCGTKVQSAADQPPAQSTEAPAGQEVLICPTCGYENDPTSQSCSSCGSYLRGAKKEPAYKVETAPDKTPVSETKRETPHQLHAPKPKNKIKPVRSQASQKPSEKKGFHLEPIQIGAIVAALFLGGVLVYGLMSSRPTPPPGGNNQGSDSLQQQSSTNQPSANVLHEINRLHEIVDKNPSDLTSTLHLANILQDNQMYDQAEIYYKRYLDKVPDNADATVDYGVTLFEGGHTQQAITELKKALKINPRHQIGLFNLGIVYMNSGDFSDAMATFKKCVEVDPNSEIGKKAQQTIEQHASLDTQEVN